MKLLFAVTALFCYIGAHAASEQLAGSVPASEITPAGYYSASRMAEVAGRVLILLALPGSSEKLLAGTAHAGLWQSGDGGVSWVPASELMKGLPVSTLVVDPGNPAIIYAGTGDGHSSGASLRGGGIFKSVDGGRSWMLLPLTNPATVGENWSHVNSIAISATGIMLAATSDNQFNGFVYRSVDGGQSWGILPVYAGSKVGPRNVVYQIKFDADHPDTAIFMDAYANVTHSSDGGVSWSVARKSASCP